MHETKFTPGPWAAVFSPGMKGPGVHIRPHDQMLLIAYANGSTSERPEHDARLIAAAPRMFHAIEAFIFSRDDEDAMKHTKLNEMIEAYRQAKGET